jgi:AcrR family transcriptional regulator
VARNRTIQKSVPRSGADEATRTRLLDAAGPIFAANGFHWTKIRDVCARAGANVAAVNYHFGDKLGLYTEVLRYSIRAAELSPELTSSAPDLPPEARLHKFIRMILDCVFNSSRPAWHMRLVLQEMTHPTPALSELIKEFIRPRYDILCTLVASINGEEPRSRVTQFCAHSIVGQARHYVIGSPVIAAVWPELTFTAKDLDEIAAHITAFSLAGIRAVSAARRSKRAAKGRC